MGIYQPLDSANIQRQFISALEAGGENIWALGLSYMNSESDRATEEYNWLGQVPPMARWIGNRAEKFFNKYSLTIGNYTYETTIPVDVNDAKRDKTGFIMRRVGELAQRANNNWNSLVATLQNNGGGSTSGLTYDGQYMFDSDHNESGSNQSNLLTSTEIPSANVSTASAPTPTEAANILNEAIGYLMSLTDDQGEPINQDMTGLTVVCSKATVWSGFNIAANPTVTNLASGASNPVRGLPQNISVLFSPRLTAADSIHVYVNDASTYRPYILQDEQGVEFQALQTGSDETFMADRYMFGIRAVRGAGYGAWQKALRITMS